MRILMYKYPKIQIWAIEVLMRIAAPVKNVLCLCHISRNINHCAIHTYPVCSVPYCPLKVGHKQLYELLVRHGCSAREWAAALIDEKHTPHARRHYIFLHSLLLRRSPRSNLGALSV